MINNESDDGTPEYEVQSIIDKKLVKGNISYLIHWKGYDIKESTWEPIQNLYNCMDSVVAYEENNKKNEKEVEKPLLKSKRKSFIPEKIYSISKYDSDSREIKRLFKTYKPKSIISAISTYPNIIPTKVNNVNEFFLKIQWNNSDDIVEETTLISNHIFKIYYPLMLCDYYEKYIRIN